MAPCYPVPETFPNRCLAEQNDFVVDIVNGECETELEDTCKTDSDCLLPGEYAARSSCPFQAKCLDAKCVVVCPR
jgi:hypothetical protein